MSEPEVNFDEKLEKFMRKLKEEQSKEEKKKARMQKAITWIFRIFFAYCIILGSFVLLALLARLLYPVFDVIIHAFTKLFI